MRWLAGWNKRIKFNIDPTTISEDLYNFPVLVKLDVICSDIFSELGTNNKRILFRSDNFEKPFHCEIAQWDVAGTEAYIWVKIPFISATTNNIFYMFYDNSQTDNTEYVYVTGNAYLEEVNTYTKGTFSGAAVVVSDYIRLNTAVNSTSGYYSISGLNIMPEFTVKFSHWSGGGNGADYVYFGWGETALYIIYFDEYNDRIYLNVNNTTVQTITGISNIDNSTWGEIEIQTTLIDNNINIKAFFRSTLYINYSGAYVKNANIPVTWGAANGGLNNEHRVKNLRIYNKINGTGGIWDENFILVNHLSQDPSSYIIDSTSNAYIGTPNGSMTSANLVNGFIGKALNFDGVDDFISIGTNNCCYKISLTNSFTFTCAIKKEDIPTTHDCIFSMHAASGDSNRLQVFILENTNVLNVRLTNTSSIFIADLSGTTNLCDGGFHDITVTYDNATRALSIFEAGVLDTTLTASAAWSIETNGRVSIGQEYDVITSDFFAGVIDEIFISNTVFSSSKILALHKVRSNTLLTYFSPEAIANGTLPYANKITLTIPYGNISSTLYNFPVLINLTISSGLTKQDLTPLFNALEGTVNRKKIAITDYTGVAICTTEIEKWDSAGKSAQLWVKVPVISSTTDTILYLYYDKNSEDNMFIGDWLSSNAKEVWNSNFYSVYHASQKPSSIMYDSTINAKDRPSYGGMSDLNIISTTTGNIHYFDGIDDCMVAPSTAASDPINNFSFECVCKALTTHEIDAQSTSSTTGVSGQKYIFFAPTDPNTSNSVVYLSVGTNGISVYEHAGGYMPPLAVYSATIGSDYNHICIVYSNKTPSIYLNGTKVHTGLTSPKSAVRCPVSFGGQSYGYFNGYLGKIRMSSVALSDAWVKATYYSNFDNLVVYTLPSAATTGWLNTYEKGVLSPWAKRIEINIDNTKIGSPLNNFPILLNINNSAGITNKDLTDIFTDLTYTITGYNFPEINGSTPDSRFWQGTAIVIDNKLIFTSYKTVTSTFTFYGNIDVQIDFDMSGSPSSDSHALCMDFCQADSAIVYKVSLRRESDDIYYYSVHRYEAATWVRDFYVSTTDRSGKLRMKIEDSVIYFFYWDGSAWNSMYNRACTFSLSYNIRFIAETWDTNPSLYSTISNFIINEGVAIWTNGTFIDNSKIALTYEDGTTQLPVEIERWNTYDIIVKNPPYIDSTYVKSTSTFSGYYVYNVANRASSLIGAAGGAGWLSNNQGTNQKVNIDYGTSFIAKRVYVENHHNSGTSTTYGMRVSILYGTNDATAFANTTYADTTNLTQLLNFTPRAHVAENRPDPQYFDIVNNKAPFRYYIICIASSYTTSYIGARHIEVQGYTDNYEIQLWTKVPVIKTNEVTKLFLYYDYSKSNNDNYVGNIGTAVAKSLWDTKHIAVYHLSQDPFTTIKDSSNNYYNLTSAGYMNDFNLVDDTSGKAMTFDGSDDYLVNASLKFTLNMTILCRVYLNTLTGGTIVHQGNTAENPQQGTFIVIQGDGKIQIGYCTATVWRYVYSQQAICAIGENTICVIINSTNLTCTFYVNNIKEVISIPAVLTIATTQSFYIGKIHNSSTPSTYFNGIIKELRILNTVDISLVEFNTIKEYFKDNLLTFKDTEVYTEPTIEVNTYTYQGYIKEKGQPIVRNVLLYERATGLLIDSTLSASTGAYLLETHSDTEHFIVVLDNIPEYKYAPMIQDRLLPNGE